MLADCNPSGIFTTAVASVDRLTVRTEQLVVVSIDVACPPLLALAARVLHHGCVLHECDVAATLYQAPERT